MTNSTSADATFRGAWCNRMITKQQGCHSTTPADKQINEERYNQPLPFPCFDTDIKYRAQKLIGLLF